MENLNTYNLLFYIRTNRTDSNGKAPIYARITVNGARAEFSINRNVSVAKWNNEAGRMIGNTEDAQVLNEYIKAVDRKIDGHHTELLKSKKKITAQAIRNAYMGVAEVNMTLMELIQYHNEQMAEKIGIDFAKATATRYNTLLNNITEFLKHKYKIQDLYLSELNYKFVADFEHYLKTVRKCNHNSTLKYIRNLRKVIHIAVLNDWLAKDPFMNFKGTMQEVEREFLDADELQRLEKKEFKIARLDAVRDMFVFACYTGLAYVDVCKFDSDQIVTGMDGGKCIFTHREKTDTKVKVPLLPKALELINKYKNHPECKITGKIFPVRSNQKMNAYLKEIAEVCGISKQPTFHIARHTFATTVTLTNGVPIESVSSMLGHKNIRTTQIYAKVVEKKVSEDMQALKKRLTQNTKKKKLAET